MVLVRELARQPASDGDEYEDVDSDDYTDSEEMDTPVSSGIARTYLNRVLAFFPRSWPRGKLSDNLMRLMKSAGNIAWILATSMIMVGLPVLFAYDREKSLQDQQLMGGMPGSI